MQRLRAGLVGLNFGNQVLEGMLLSGPGEPYFEVAAVCDMDVAKAVGTAERIPGCVAYPEYAQLLENESISVILLFTGPNGRAEMISQAIRAGKDVITTKPFELDPVAAAEVLAEARSLGRMIYLNSPCAAESEDFATIRRWREAHHLGRPVAAHYECWYKRIEVADGSWYDDPGKCPVAPLFRLGIYGLNDLVRIFGDAEAIQVMETRIFTGRPTPDLAKMQIKFRDGSLASLVNGWVQQPARNASSLTLYFENGTIFRNPTMMPQLPMDSSGRTIMALVTKECTDGMPIETADFEESQLSSAYQWKIIHHAFSTRRRPENETPDVAIISAVNILAAMGTAATQQRTVQI